MNPQYAFPCIYSDYIQYGLTKREHIAAMILQGLVSNNGLTSSSTTPQELCAKALLITDELLNQLEI